MTADIGILLSGRGSNFLALHSAIEGGEVDARIAMVVSNRPGAPGLSAARELGLDAEAIPQRGLDRAEHDARVVDLLRRAGVQWVCLAGYMRILSPVMLEAYPERILNIHPSLLPAFPGLHAQKQAWEYGVQVSGCTVHLVDAGMDTGPIVDQAAVFIGDAESAEEAAARILKQEHRLYPRALQKILARPWRLDGRRVLFEKVLDKGRRPL